MELNKKLLCSLGYEASNGLIYIKKCVPAMQTLDVYNGSDFKSWDFLDKCVNIALQFNQGKPIIFLGIHIQQLTQ